MKDKPVKACTIDAPCKINLHLKIGEKMGNGFHNLESLFAALAFGDTLRLECSENDGECCFSANWDSLPFMEPGREPFLSEGAAESDHLQVVKRGSPPGENLIIRAVALFREHTGYNCGLKIFLQKRIPLGAGLGGGSSNAASSLLALNRLSGGALSMDEIKKMVISLGSDVPFFLSGGLAFASGRGELIEKVKFSRELWVVLVMPPFSSDTALAYKYLDDFREGNQAKKGKTLTKEALLHSLEEPPSSWPFQNDFLQLFLEYNQTDGDEWVLKAKTYRAILEELKKHGASFAGLSGSGSSCFGIFEKKSDAERAEIKLNEAGALLSECSKWGNSAQKRGIFTRLTFFLARRADPVLQYST